MNIFGTNAKELEDARLRADVGIVKGETQRLDISFADFNASAEAEKLQRAAAAAGEVA